MKRLIQCLVLSVAVLAAPVFAIELDEAKNEGLVGERADGYLGLVDTGADDAVVALVAEVNEKREAAYKRIAAENNLEVEQVEALAGKKAIEKTTAGHWILLNGGWQKK